MRGGVAVGEIDLSQLDPGIRGAVAWLRMHGFDTTDSGDADDLGGPHVSIVVAPEYLVAEADRLLNLMVENGFDVGPPGPDCACICAEYDPATGLGVIELVGFTC